MSQPIRRSWCLKIAVALLITMEAGFAQPHEQHCHVLINEVNTDNPGNLAKTMQFIELHRSCGSHKHAKGNYLAGYKLVLIRGYPLSVTMVINLHSVAMRAVRSEGKFAVIAGPDIAVEWKVPLSSSFVTSVYENNMLPLGNDSPYAIVLLQSSRISDLNAVSLSKDPLSDKYVPLQLNTNAETSAASECIKSYIKDMVVYGRRVPTNRCLYFDNLWPKDSGVQNAGDNYIIRDYDSDDYKDLSMNRCDSESMPFKFKNFKLGVPTPGNKNDCNGAPFSVEHYINDISPRLPTTAFQVQPIPGCSADDPVVSSQRYRDIDGASYAKQVKIVMEEAASGCLNEDDIRSTVEEEMNIVVEQQLIIRSGGQPFTPEFKKHVFKQEWIEQCSVFLPRHGEILQNTRVQSWLDIEVVGVNDDKTCRFSCFACKAFFSHGLRADVKRKTSISTPEGYFNNRPQRILDSILNHENCEIHKDAQKFITNMALVETHQEYLKILQAAQEKEDKLLLATTQLVRFVYAEILADVSFVQHPFFMDVLKTYNVNVGTKHHNAVAAHDITTVISSSFHASLLSYLVTTNMPFSIMVDSTTDCRQIPNLIIYIQTIEDLYPIVYLYALIPLDLGESSKEMMASLTLRIEQDNIIQPGFQNFFITRLKIFASDGCSSMIGSKQSFKTELKTYLGRNVASVWCMAHRTNLAVQRAILKNKDPDFKYFLEFEKINNKFYGFYLSRGSKRFQHLSSIAEELGINTRRLKYKFEIRWASSHRRAVEALQQNYKLLRNDVTAIMYDDSFTEDAKKQADELHTILEDKPFPAVLAEYCDFLGVFKYISLELQETQGLLVEKYGIIQRAMDDLEQLKESPGAHLSTFLKSCSCSTCVLGSCTLKDYSECEYPTCNNLALRNTSSSTINLFEVRPKLYQELQKGIRFYFNLDLLLSFELFNPKNLAYPTCPSIAHQASNTTVINTQHYRPIALDNFYKLFDIDSHWKTICTFYYDDGTQQGTLELEECLSSSSDWDKILRYIREDANLQTNLVSQASRFWPYVLQYEGIPWTDATKAVIINVLVTPFGTADAERGYSYLNNIKSNERSSLSPETVESIIRVKVNGPKEITSFNAAKYAKEFVKLYSRSDDSSVSGGRPRNPLTDHSFFRNSRLF